MQYSLVGEADDTATSVLGGYVFFKYDNLSLTTMITYHPIIKEKKFFFYQIFLW